MTTYVARRLLAAIPLLLIVSALVFALSYLIPGDPAVELAGGTHATREQVIKVRHQLHFDEPLVKQYARWLTHALRGDLGQSLIRNRSVSSEIRSRFPVTFSLALGGLVVTLLLGVPAGILAGTRAGSARDRAIALGTSAGIAIPDFWIAMVLVVVFAVKLKALPAIGYTSFTASPVSWARHLVLPAIALGLSGAATLARQLRGALADVLDQDYIRTANAKGLKRRMVIGKHALKNASITPVTVLGIQFAYMLGGTVLLEYIFSIPGMGQYFFLALNNRDLPVIQGVTLLTALIFVVLNLGVDITYAYVNPKVRLG